jgi:hypothetical protein
MAALAGSFSIIHFVGSLVTYRETCGSAKSPSFVGRNTSSMSGTTNIRACSFSGYDRSHSATTWTSAKKMLTKNS